MHDDDVWEPRLPVEHGFPEELVLALGQLRDFAASLNSDAVADAERMAFDARAHALRRELEALGLAVAGARHAARRGPARDAVEQRDRETVAAFMERRPSEVDYLREVEGLARTVADEAIDRYGSDLYETTADDPLVRALSSLARTIREVHWDGDGCLDDD